MCLICIWDVLELFVNCGDVCDVCVCVNEFGCVCDVVEWEE